ncbi:hypothetical protein AN1V17_03000 [Vallitalea sediminicola]
MSPLKSGAAHAIIGIHKIKNALIMIILIVFLHICLPLSSNISSYINYISNQPILLKIIGHFTN